jgi:hypothetical protein
VGNALTSSGVVASRFWATVKGHGGAAALGLGIGLALAGTASYMSVRWNNARVISDITATATVIPGLHGGWVLDLQYASYRDTTCPNQTEHLLERSDGGAKIIWPIEPSTVNMLEKMGPASELHVRYELPPDIASGTWYYVARASDFCEWMPGLVRTSIRVTRPVEVVVP